VTTLETLRITPACRRNRTVDGAWNEAVRRLREIYDAQVSHDPTLVLALSIRRTTDQVHSPDPAAAEEETDGRTADNG
jgi:hypothetical protein